MLSLPDSFSFSSFCSTFPPDEVWLRAISLAAVLWSSVTSSPPFEVSIAVDTSWSAFAVASSSLAVPVAKHPWACKSRGSLHWEVPASAAFEMPVALGENWVKRWLHVTLRSCLALRSTNRLCRASATFTTVFKFSTVTWCCSMLRRSSARAMDSWICAVSRSTVLYSLCCRHSTVSWRLAKRSCSLESAARR